MNTFDPKWWVALKKLKGNWYHHPQDGLIHISKSHVADDTNGKCNYCKAKAPASIRMISKLQKLRGKV